VPQNLVDKKRVESIDKAGFKGIFISADTASTVGT
jgi:hypothetical protein